jgi:uncharacterized OB-fold protein
MFWIDHPACKDCVSVIRWLKYHIGEWMFDKGDRLRDSALYPNRCRECGAKMTPGQKDCDHIPF